MNNYISNYQRKNINEGDRRKIEKEVLQHSLSCKYCRYLKEKLLNQICYSPIKKLERKIVIQKALQPIMFKKESICYLIAFHEDRGAGGFFFLNPHSPD